MTRLVIFLAAIVAVALAAGPAAADRRVALIIGNGAYQNTPALPNPINDARDIGAALTANGFDDVAVVTNLTGEKFKLALRDFARKAREADVALVYYAGHGFELGGRNFLVPVDAQLRSETDADFETVPLDMILSAVDSARSLRIVLIDACRDNPLASQMVAQGRSAGRQLGRGLARVELTRADTVLSFATRPGRIALDGEGGNSPFATALIRHMGTPGLDMRLMFGRMRDSVMELTKGAQDPIVWGPSGGVEFSFAPAAPASGTADPAQVELAFWNGVAASSSAAVLRTYLDRYPQGTFAALARARVEELEAAGRPAVAAPRKATAPAAEDRVPRAEPKPARPPAARETRAPAAPATAPRPASPAATSRPANAPPVDSTKLRRPDIPEGSSGFQ